MKKDTGNDVLTLQTDQGKEFLNSAFTQYLDDMTIHYETSTVYTPQQNGYIERDNQTVMEMARSLLHAKDLPLKLWAEAVIIAVYLLNRTINSQLGLITPYESWFGTKPSIKHYKIFGSIAWVFVNKERRTKLDPKSMRTYFVGYSATSKAYRFWEPLTDKIIESSDYTINEKSGKYDPSFPSDLGRDNYIHLTIDIVFPTSDSITVSPSIPDTIDDSSNENLEDFPISGSEDQVPSPDRTIPIPEEDTSLSSDVSILPSTDSNILSPAVGVINPTHLQDEPNNPQLPDYSNFPDLPEEPNLPDLSKLDPMHLDAIRLSNALIASVGEAISEPQTYHEAISSANFTYWQEAMDREYASLLENQTWDSIEKPSDRKPVQNKWVYKVKYKPNGEVDKFKARLVAKSFTQKPSIDFTETYLPVIRYDSIRAILAIAAAKGMYLKQFDIGIAFLNGELSEEIYMAQPQGYIDPTKPKYYCRLKKSIYGLRQSARQWNHRISTFLKQFRLVVSEADCCVYSNHGQLHTILGIYVDDGLIASTNTYYIESILIYLESTFKVTRGEMDYFVGFQIERCPTTGSIFVHQERYILDVLIRFGLQDAHEVSTPADTHIKLWKNNYPKDPEVDVPYRQGVGCLMYTTIITRLDISYAMNKVSLFQEHPRQSHWTAIKRIMRYLKRTKRFGLYYHGPSSSPRLIGYADVDYGGDLDD